MSHSFLSTYFSWIIIWYFGEKTFDIFPVPWIFYSLSSQYFRSRIKDDILPPPSSPLPLRLPTSYIWNCVPPGTLFYSHNFAHSANYLSYQTTKMLFTLHIALRTKFQLHHNTPIKSRWISFLLPKFEFDNVVRRYGVGRNIFSWIMWVIYSWDAALKINENFN